MTKLGEIRVEGEEGVKKIKLVKVTSEENPAVETLSCLVLGVPRGSFTVRRCAASDEAWEIVKERLFGDPSTDLPEGVAVASDGRMYAPGDVVRGLPVAEWQRRTGANGEWHIDSNDFANGGAFYEVRRRPTRTERVAWGVDLLGREVEGKPKPINYLNEMVDGRYYGHLGIGARQVWAMRCTDPDGMVTVLAEDGER